MVLFNRDEETRRPMQRLIESVMWLAIAFSVGFCSGTGGVRHSRGAAWEIAR